MVKYITNNNQILNNNMKTIFLIEVNPIVKSYFSDVHCGWINETNDIEEAQHYKTYDEAYKRLVDIIDSDYDSAQTLYLSIVNFKVKQ